MLGKIKRLKKTAKTSKKDADDQLLVSLDIGTEVALRYLVLEGLIKRYTICRQVL